MVNNMAFRNNKTSVADLQALGINTDICAYCKLPLRMRLDQIDDIPSYYLFVNKIRNIYAILHRKCKKPFLEKKRK